MTYVRQHSHRPVTLLTNLNKRITQPLVGCLAFACLNLQAGLYYICSTKVYLLVYRQPGMCLQDLPAGVVR